MIKHDNNFILYTLGSACLLVFSLLLVHSSSYEYTQNMLASVISVSAQVEDRHEQVSTEGFFFGKVTDSQGRAIPDVKLILWSTSGDSGLSEILATTFSDSVGGYMFEVSHPGTYAVSIEYVEDEGRVISPPSQLVGFSQSSHYFSFTITEGRHYVAGLDFTIALID